MDQDLCEVLVTAAEEEPETPAILEEVVIEELAVDGICGIY
jgi:mycofactocin precursor